MHTQSAGASHVERPKISITVLWCLPAEKRNALSAVYAFMRHADDISDEPGVDPSAESDKSWRSGCKPQRRYLPAVRRMILFCMALGDAQKKFKIPPDLFEKLVYGTSLDLEIPPASADAPAILCNTFEDLRQYCYHVASVVGLVCIRIFGYEDSKAEFLAEDCGLAFQLTNIIRDVKEDASLGRIYIPAEDLARPIFQRQILLLQCLQNPAQAATFASSA